MLETLSQFATISILAMTGIIVLMIGASTTSIGRALLPDAVVNAVAKLVPSGVILDAEATACGEFHLQVEGATKLKTVYVRRDQETTIAWTFDPTLECPRSGTYAFAEFRHNLDADSTIEPTPRNVHARIEAALAATLPAKQFAVADAGDADILVHAFAAIDDAGAEDDLMDGFQYQHSDEWRSAIKTALAQGDAESPTKFARGSLMLYLFDSRSRQLLWHAAAISRFAVDVSDLERETRIQLTVREMLNKFPPV